VHQNPAPAFATVAITSKPIAPAVPHSSGLIEVEFEVARRITGAADPEAITSFTQVLRGH
jgi:hypothetical protein